jgi:hypothetical protein
MSPALKKIIAPPFRLQTNHLRTLAPSRQALDFKAPFRGLLLEHELFRSPVSTFRDHAPACYRSRCWELGWELSRPSSNTPDAWSPPPITKAPDRYHAACRQAGLIRGVMSESRLKSRR